MPYDHSTKVGNQGDLVKHAVLYAVTEELLANKTDSGPFTYLDAHAGRPEYVLPESGEWRQGIGAFSESASICEDRRVRPKTGGTLGWITAFDEAVIGGPQKVGMRYAGSSGLMFRLLRHSRSSFEMRLWETDPAAHDDLVRYFHPWTKTISVFHTNGFEGVAATPQASLVLIDPPSLDYATAALALAQQLHGRGIPYIVWMPRTSRSSTTPASEAQTSQDYIASAAKIGHCEPVQWHNWGHRSPGCSITVPRDLGAIVSGIVQQLVQIMDWK